MVPATRTFEKSGAGFEGHRLGHQTAQPIPTQSRGSWNLSKCMRVVFGSQALPLWTSVATAGRLDRAQGRILPGSPKVHKLSFNVYSYLCHGDNLAIIHRPLPSHHGVWRRMPEPPCAMPLARRGTQPLAEPRSVVAAFQEKLAEGHTTSSWLDEQIQAASPSTCSTSARAQPGSRVGNRSSARPGTQPAVEPATTQIVNRALRLLKTNTARSGGEGEASTTPDALVLKKASLRGHLCLIGLGPAFRQHLVASSISMTTGTLRTPLQGLDAFSGVGKMMEGLAHTLDDVIGQAFKDWSTPLTAGPSGGGTRAEVHSAPLQDNGEPWTDFGVPEEWGPEAGGRRRGSARGGKPGAKPKTMSPFLNRLNAVSGGALVLWEGCLEEERGL